MIQNLREKFTKLLTGERQIRKFAKKTKIPYATLWRFVNGRQASEKTLIKIEKFLKN